MNKNFNELFIKINNKTIREHEHYSLPGSFYFLWSQVICYHLFDPTIYKLCVINLTFGDPFAAILGIYFEKSYKFTTDKNIAGSFGGALIAMLMGKLYLNFLQINHVDFIKDYLILYISALFSEIGVPYIKVTIDDNLTIPIYTGFLLQFFKTIL